MELAGILKDKSQIKTFEGSDFKVQEFYLDCQKFNQDTGEPIPNLLKFKVSGNKIDQLAQFNKGEKIKIAFNIKGRLFDKKDDSGKGHSQNLDAWKIERVAGSQTAQTSQSNAPEEKTFAEAVIEDDGDEMPF